MTTQQISPTPHRTASRIGITVTTPDRNEQGNPAVANHPCDQCGAAAGEPCVVRHPAGTGRARERIHISRNQAVRSR